MELETIIHFEYPVYAHISENKEPETLAQHTEKCERYFHRLSSEKRFQSILNRYLKEYLGPVSDIAYDEAKFILNQIISFHDLGKINPAFQKEKMKQKEFSFGNLPCLSGTKHSFFSSVIYLDYCYKRIQQVHLKRAEKRKLKALAYIGAYVISRHHTDLDDMENFRREFDLGGQAYMIIEYLTINHFFMYKGPFFFNTENIRLVMNVEKEIKEVSPKLAVYNDIVIRLLYSFLTASDYYATAEYMSGYEVKHFGNEKDKDQLSNLYEASNLMKQVRNYEKEYYGKKTVADMNDMNALRSEMFLDAERSWKDNQKENIFFLEAPTGSGKSNAAMNLSFQMLKTGQDKIFYIYPFNTLAEQNLEALRHIYGECEEVFSKIAVVNSVTPIKTDRGKRKTEETETGFYYQAALLDRQFLNYSFIITTHVSWFETLFGNCRESVFGFHQIAGSVVVLDEIQSYKNQIWSEIMFFLTVMAELMEMKIIIMSATLPDLSYLTDLENQVVSLIKNRREYFEHPIFCQRVQVSYELLENKMTLDELYEHIRMHSTLEEGVIVEFIKKDTAYQFFQFLCESELDDRRIRLLTGDDNILDRTAVLREIKENKKGIILVATQVVEAGVDIDMDIGYKDISKLDSEEQFLGRINRSCKGKGTAYFFDMDAAEKIYTNDIRRSAEFTLKNPQMRLILSTKRFEQYYSKILKVLKEQLNQSSGEDGLEYFYKQVVAGGRFRDVSDRMKLIEETDWNLSVYLSRCILMEDGTCLDGWECWKEYKDLLTNEKINYAEKQVKLSRLRQKMQYFIYEIKKSSDLIYSDRIGELYAIQDGEQYFVNGKLDKHRLEKAGGQFIEL